MIMILYAGMAKLLRFQGSAATGEFGPVASVSRRQCYWARQCDATMQSGLPRQRNSACRAVNEISYLMMVCDDGWKLLRARSSAGRQMTVARGRKGIIRKVPHHS